MVHQDLVLLDPFAVGLAGGEGGLEFFVGDDALLGEVHQQHFAGLQAAFRFDVFRPDGQHAGFRGHDQLAVMRFEPAGGAQTVTVKSGADHTSVGERDGGGTIPGFHEGGVIFVERGLVLRHGRVAIPGFGYEHRHDMR